MTPQDFARRANVSRETLARLEIHAALLARFQNTINLVARGSLKDPWRRHFLDSAQLLPLLLPPAGGQESPPIVLDLGSGAGFPGLVLALLGDGAGTPLRVHLVESDSRKCAFLREVARQTGCRVTIHNGRLEALAPFAVDVISARAFAPLPRILELSEPFLAFPGAHPVALLLKGLRAREELTAAAKGWKMNTEIIPSITGAGAVVLRLRDIVRA